MVGPDKLSPIKIIDEVLGRRNAVRCRPFPLLILLILVSACDRTSELVNRETAPTGSDLATEDDIPRRILRECVHAYGQLKSYEDRAYVSLRYTLDGQRHHDRAPLSIAWEHGGRLGLRVYSVAAGPSDGRWRLRLGAEEEAVDGQVLSRAVPQELNFDWLLSDPLVAQNLSAGLAGFPPQLDLLLSPEPLSGLLQEHAELALEPQQEIGGRSCHVVSVTRGPAKYRMVIDRASMLLRRLHLPDANLPREMLNDRRVSDATLTIEFEGTRLNRPIDWQEFQLDVQADEALVNHFVPAPPSLETRQLGSRLPGFILHAPNGDEVFETGQTNRSSKATVLMWLADHPACRLAAQQFAEAKDTIANDPQLRNKVEFVSIWAELDPPTGESFSTLATAWGLPGKLAIDRDAMGRDLFGVQEAPTVIILDDANRLHYRESRANPALSQILPSLIARLAAGENLAASLLHEESQLSARHAAELCMAQSVEAGASAAQASQAGESVMGRGDLGQTRGPSPAALQNYEPLLLTLREVDRRKHLTQVLTATVDDTQHSWKLDTNGQLVQSASLTAGDEAPKSFQTPWSASENSKLCVSSKAEFVALCRFPSRESTAGKPNDDAEQFVGQIEILDTRDGRSQTMHLGSNATPVDLQWLSLSGATSPRLAVITSDHRTLLLDPQNREQLSGDCPAAPLAILPGSPENTLVDGWIVLSDRSIQPLQLSAESTHNSLKTLSPRNLARPASHSKDLKPGTLQPVRRLEFWPGKGPWLACSGLSMQPWADADNGSRNNSTKNNSAQNNTSLGTLTLARGWIARDEPAAFLLDNNLHARWHVRLALQPERSRRPAMSAAIDPISGLATWVVSDTDQIIHVMRSDGLTDHFRISDHWIGLELFARGERLLLQVVEPKQTTTYELRWR